MKDTLARMLELEREGRHFVVATVVRTQGSTPQVVGARMIVDDQGGMAGTLGGGCVEGDAIAEAQRVLVEGGSSLREYELTEPLAWDTGLVCGGTMWIHIEPDRAALGGPCPSTDAQGTPSSVEGWTPRLQAALDDAGRTPPIAFGTRLLVRGRHVAAEGHCLIDRADQAVATGDKARRALADAFERGVARLVPIDESHELLVEPIVARPRLVIAGGGHVGLALARMAQLLDYQITVIDDREDFANTTRFPGVEVIQGDISSTVTSLDVGWNTFIVVATRGHKLDSHALRAAVATPARYVGLLGSKRKTVLIEKMLREEGASEARLRAVHAPIGLDFGGRTPGEIALSILGEMSQERFGGSARPLRLPDQHFAKAVAE